MSNTMGITRVLIIMAITAAAATTTFTAVAAITTDTTYTVVDVATDAAPTDATTTATYIIAAVVNVNVIATFNSAACNSSTFKRATVTITSTGRIAGIATINLLCCALTCKVSARIIFIVPRYLHRYICICI